MKTLKEGDIPFSLILAGDFYGALFTNSKTLRAGLIFDQLENKMF